MTESVKLTNAALDEIGADIVIRGVIDPSSLGKLQVAPYQREILAINSIRELAAAIREGGVPDICLGMRGGQYMEREGAFYLQDAVYIIDGLQRRTAALEILRSGELPHLGATVYCNTDEKRERDMFRKLNMSRAKLSPNVLLRNEKYENEFVAMLFELCKDSSFVLHHKVSWDQRMKRGELMTAIGILKVVGRLHSRFRGGLLESSHAILSANMATLMQRLGRKVVRDNIKHYWQTIDEMYDIRNVTFKEGAGYLRQTFNIVLARVFASHEDFWNDAEFKISIDLKRKLSLFPITDPHVASLCSSTGPSKDILYNLFVQHINSGRRSRRLKPFMELDEPDSEEMNDDEEDEDENGEMEVA